MRLYTFLRKHKKNGVDFVFKLLNINLFRNDIKFGNKVFLTWKQSVSHGKQVVSIGETMSDITFISPEISIHMRYKRRCIAD